MEKLEKNATTGGDVKTGVIPVLQGSDTGCPNVRVVVMGAVRCNYEGGGGQSCGFIMPDGGKAGKATCRLDMEDTVG